MDSNSFLGELNSLVISWLGIELSPADRVNSLLRILDGSDKKQKLEALEQLQELSLSKEFQQVLGSAESKFVGVLVGILRKTKAKARLLACSIAWNITSHPDNKAYLAGDDVGLIVELIKIASECDGDMRAMACSALRNLSTFPSNRLILSDSSKNLCEILQRIIRADSNMARLKACSIFRNLTVFHDSAIEILKSPGSDLINVMVKVTEDISAGDARVHACGALANLSHHQDLVTPICGSGVLPVLKDLLLSDDNYLLWPQNDTKDDLANKALNAVVNISRVDTAIPQLVSVGLLPILINLLSISSVVCIKASIAVANIIFSASHDQIIDGMLADLLGNKTRDGKHIVSLVTLFENAEESRLRSQNLGPSTMLVGNISCGAGVVYLPSKKSQDTSRLLGFEEGRIYEGSIFLSNLVVIVYLFAKKRRPLLSLQYEPIYAWKAIVSVLKNLSYRSRLFSAHTAGADSYATENRELENPSAIMATKTTSAVSETAKVDFIHLVCSSISEAHFDLSVSEQPDQLACARLGLEALLSIIICGIELRNNKSVLSEFQRNCMEIIQNQELMLMTQLCTATKCLLLGTNCIESSVSQFSSSYFKVLRSIVKLFAQTLSSLRLLGGGEILSHTANAILEDEFSRFNHGNNCRCSKELIWHHAPLQFQHECNGADIHHLSLFIDCSSTVRDRGEVSRFIRDLALHGVKLQSYEDAINSGEQTLFSGAPNIVVFCSNSCCVEAEAQYAVMMACQLALRSSSQVIAIILPHHTVEPVVSPHNTKSRVFQWIQLFHPEAVSIISDDFSDRESLIKTVLESSWSGTRRTSHLVLDSVQDSRLEYPSTVLEAAADLMEVITSISTTLDRSHCSTIEDQLREFGVSTALDFCTIEMMEDLLVLSTKFSPLQQQVFMRSLVRFTIIIIRHRRHHESSNSQSLITDGSAWSILTNPKNSCQSPVLVRLLEEWGVFNGEDLQCIDAAMLAQLLSLLKCSPRGSFKLALGLPMGNEGYPAFAVRFIANAATESSDELVDDAKVTEWLHANKPSQISVAVKLRLDAAWEIINNATKVIEIDQLHGLLKGLGVLVSEDLRFLSPEMMASILPHIKLAQRKKFLQLTQPNIV